MTINILIIQPEKFTIHTRSKACVLDSISYSKGYIFKTFLPQLRKLFDPIFTLFLLNSFWRNILLIKTNYYSLYNVNPS
jgi:hypothetical protein